MKKDKKNQKIEITASLDEVDNSFHFSSKEDIDHLCFILKAQAKNGSDIRGYVSINRMSKE